MRESRRWGRREDSIPYDAPGGVKELKEYQQRRPRDRLLAGDAHNLIPNEAPDSLGPFLGQWRDYLEPPMPALQIAIPTKPNSPRWVNALRMVQGTIRWGPKRAHIRGAYGYCVRPVPPAPLPAPKWRSNTFTRVVLKNVRRIRRIVVRCGAQLSAITFLASTKILFVNPLLRCQRILAGYSDGILVKHDELIMGTTPNRIFI